MLETPARIEPCLFEEEVPRVLADLAVEIQKESADIGYGLNKDSLAELADLVRMMNSYYSNLIEGHNTRPLDIERALAGAEIEPEKRPLALEAKAHVEVQRGIDMAYATGKSPVPVSADFISSIHKAFYDEMPSEFRVTRRADGIEIPVVPGKFRSLKEEDTSVGRHVPPSSEAVPAFMAYFEKRFTAAETQASSRIISIATAHHRLNYIHPFIDGNGRVSRLMSHAMCRRAGIGGAGLWSVSRGLARGLKERSEYKRMMDAADAPRAGDRDGRGNLSEKALVMFSEWFLSVMLDQIRFSKAMFQLDRIHERYKDLLVDLRIDRRAIELVMSIFKFGEMERGDAGRVLRMPDRTARTVVSKVVAQGFLKSTTPKGPLRVAFPLEYRERLFPNLFGEGKIDPPEAPKLQSDH